MRQLSHYVATRNSVTCNTVRTATSVCKNLIVAIPWATETTGYFLINVVSSFLKVCLHARFVRRYMQPNRREIAWNERGRYRCSTSEKRERTGVRLGLCHRAPWNFLLAASPSRRLSLTLLLWWQLYGPKWRSKVSFSTATLRANWIECQRDASTGFMVGVVQKARRTSRRIRDINSRAVTLFIRWLYARQLSRWWRISNERQRKKRARKCWHRR